MPRLTLRRLVVVASIGVVAAATGLVAMVANGILGAVDAIVIGLGGLAVAMLGALGLGLRRYNGHLHNGFRAARKQLDAFDRRLNEHETRVGEVAERAATRSADAVGAIAEDRLRLARALAEQTELLEGLNRQLSERLDPLAAHVAELARSVDELRDAQRAATERSAAVERAVAAVAPRVTEQMETMAARTGVTQKRQFTRLYKDVEAQTDLRGLVTPRAPMPLHGGWALDAEITHMIATMLWQRRPELIVECGSGTSSVWLGYLLEKLGHGRLVALEHDERFLAASEALVRAHGLRDVVEVRHAALEPWTDHATGGQEYQWYAQAALDDLKDISLLLVDGPPAATGPQARYPAVPLLLPRCAEDAVIVLDDAERRDETALSDRWLVEAPDLDRTIHAHGSAHVFHRRTRL